MGRGEGHLSPRMPVLAPAPASTGPSAAAHAEGSSGLDFQKLPGPGHAHLTALQSLPSLPPSLRLSPSA